MAQMPPGGDYGGGYLKVQRHLRTAVISAGFAVTTILVVPCIAQSQLTGYKYPAKTVRQTEPQDGWLYTAAAPPVFDSTVTVAPIEQSKLDGYRFPRRTVRQTEPQDGWLETAANPPFDPTIIVPPVGQSRLDGYRYPARTIRQTEPQDGWLETATHDWAVERTPYSLDTRLADRAALTYRYDGYPATDWIYQNLPVVWDGSQFQNISGDRTPVRSALRYRYDGYPGTDWIYQNLPVVWDESKFQNNTGDLTPVRSALRYRYDGYPGTDWIYENLPVVEVWDESKFQNNTGDLTPIRTALKFRYPLASAGFSTDGSTPDVWDASRFQNINWDRTTERRIYDPRYEHHKFSFGLLDARAVIPAIDQLANSERAAQRKGRPTVTSDSLGWIYENLPVAFDPQYLIHSDDSRMRARYKKVPPLDQPAQAWIYAAIPPFDTMAMERAQFRRVFGRLFGRVN